MKTVVENLKEHLRIAKYKHPGYPEDPIHRVAIMVEEAGEATQAAIDLIYHGGSELELRKELYHTGAMVLRMLEAMGGEVGDG